MPTACLPDSRFVYRTDCADTAPRSLLRGQVGAAYAGLTRLIGRGLAVALADGVTLHVTFAPDPGADSDEAVLLQGPHGALHLDAGVPFLRALTGVDVSAFDAAPAAQQEWLQAGVLGRLAGSPLASMTRLARRAQPPSTSEPATLHLSLQDGSHAVGTLARADAACWQALLAPYPLHPVRAPQAAFFALPVSIIARIARHALAPAVLRTLRAGDVIVPARPDVDVHGVGWLRGPHGLARVRYDRAGTVEFLSLESAMETEQDAAPAEQQAAPPVTQPDLDRMPVQLEFRLGALALTLGQLRTVAPGGIFQLDGEADGTVAIVAGGQRLGEGEAVDVAGRLGIRITRWDVPC